MGTLSTRRLAGTRLWFCQLLVFSAFGWLLAAILDGVGALHLNDALFVSGLVLAVAAGLLFLEGNDMPVSMRLRTTPVVNILGIGGRAGLGVPLSRAQALAVISAAVAGGGLILASAFMR